MPDQPGLRLVVMGTTAFVLPGLDALLAAGHDVVAVYTQPPRPAGRGHQLRRTPVHEAAERLGLEVRTPRTLKDPGAQAEFAALHADLAVVGAYGLLLPKPVLAAPRLGCINLHASLLPRWRGAAPIERAILAGDRETGVSIFQMEEGLDTGSVLAMQQLAIGPSTTAAKLHQRLAGLAAEMLPQVVAGVADCSLPAVPQPSEGVIYAHKLARDEGRLDFTLPAVEIERRLRALNPAPGTWCEAKGERLTLLAADVVSDTGDPGTVTALPLTIACGTDALRVTLAQRAGRRALAPDELQRGFSIPLGSRLGSAMPRYSLLLEYDGTPFQGWQRQANGPSVQAAVEQALLACSGETVNVVAAGRTDSGVHALGQVAHVDLGRVWAPERLAGALNFHLRPAPVTVLEAREVTPASTPGFPAPAVATCIASLPAAAPRLWSAAGSGTCPSRSTPSGCTSPPRPWSAATTSPASAPANARPPRR